MSKKLLVLSGIAEADALESRLAARRRPHWTDGVTTHAAAIVRHPSNGTVAVVVDARAEQHLSVVEKAALVDSRAAMVGFSKKLGATNVKR